MSLVRDATLRPTSSLLDCPNQSRKRSSAHSTTPLVVTHTLTTAGSAVSEGRMTDMNTASPPTPHSRCTTMLTGNTVRSWRSRGGGAGSAACVWRKSASADVACHAASMHTPPTASATHLVQRDHLAHAAHDARLSRVQVACSIGQRGGGGGGEGAAQQHALLPQGSPLCAPVCVTTDAVPDTHPHTHSRCRKPLCRELKGCGLRVFGSAVVHVMRCRRAAAPLVRGCRTRLAPIPLLT
jgi:hypothetical protein